MSMRDDHRTCKPHEGGSTWQQSLSWRHIGEGDESPSFLAALMLADQYFNWLKVQLAAWVDGQLVVSNPCLLS